MGDASADGGEECEHEEEALESGLHFGRKECGLNEWTGGY